MTLLVDTSFVSRYFLKLFSNLTGINIFQISSHTILPGHAYRASVTKIKFVLCEQAFIRRRKSTLIFPTQSGYKSKYKVTRLTHHSDPFENHMHLRLLDYSVDYTRIISRMPPLNFDHKISKVRTLNIGRLNKNVAGLLRNICIPDKKM